MSALTNVTNKLRSISPELESVITVLEVAQSVTGVGGAGAAQALRMLEAALKTIEAGAAGNLTADQVAVQLGQIRTSLAADRAAVDAQLAALAAGTSPGES